MRARFVGDGVSASGRGLCGREAPGWLRRGACSAGCCASGSAGRTGPRDAGQAGKRAGRGIGPRMRFAGPSGEERAGLGREVGWILVLGFLFYFFSFLNLIQTKFEFKYEFEFKPHSNKSMHQHECNTKKF